MTAASVTDRDAAQLSGCPPRPSGQPGTGIASRTTAHSASLMSDGHLGRLCG
ncbi:hypothetical protein ACWEBX_36330 [Streptomyces sp. NPDC005070]